MHGRARTVTTGRAYTLTVVWSRSDGETEKSELTEVETDAILSLLVVNEY